MVTLAKAHKDVTITLVVDDDENLDAQIVAEDNDSPSCYVVGTYYYVRLYKSNFDSVITARANFGSIELDTAEMFLTVTNELLTFDGIKSVTTDSFMSGNVVLNQVGLAYDLTHAEVSPIIEYDLGSKSLRSSEEIFAVYQASYFSRYARYKFRASRTGTLMLSFVGT